MVMLCVSSGLGFYNLSVVLEALTSQRGLSVAAVSATTALYFVVSGVCGLAVARLIESFDPRWTILAGAALGATGILMLSRAASLERIYLAYLVFGAGFAGTSLVTGSTLVTRWFVRRRGMALATASTGLSLGGVLLTPLSARLIADRGLEGAGVVLAAAYFLGVVPVTMLVLRPSPRSMGLEPDGMPPPEPDEQMGAGTVPASRSFDVATAVRSPFFLLVSASYAFAMVSQVGALTHNFKMMSDRAGAGVATLSVSVISAASIAGRLAGGWVLTRMPLRRFALLMLAVQALSLASLALARGAGPLLFSAALFGSTMGNVLMLQTLLLAEAFGVENYARIYSIGNLLAVSGIAGGPVLVGLLHDYFGGYQAGFLLTSVASWLALALMARAWRALPAD
jgi:MFS family permease